MPYVIIEGTPGHMPDESIEVQTLDEAKQVFADRIREYEDAEPWEDDTGERKARYIIHQDQTDGLPYAEITDVAKLHDLGIVIEVLPSEDEPEREYTHPDHIKFVEWANEQGHEVHHYCGRFFYEGPSIHIDSLNDVMFMPVPWQHDRLGLGWVVYPRTH